ncbi:MULTISPECIES: sugar ABC transporter substrate-binding protein [unclassified Streptomyces]|uniref:sugar ABC transporter substrate-binding protein n=1 Tax=unclassified Streptomyces TaxID=2593676 RepID=UPI002554E44F|nr:MULTISPECIES: substrate-binding domain-containing protein [unclassified Streptomyces]WRZ69279.1 substrate-binding domain-containing protein [Streptomyces sp. NBC_01257]WSU63215.1 substrate-binding domain-containing protein [Streptomyces sp. NBC_01104]
MTRTLRSAIALAGAAALSLGAVATSGAAQPGTGRQADQVKIGLLLPESKTTRYEKFDRPYIEDKIKELAPGAQIDYYNAAESATTQQQQVNTALAKGDQVLILDAVDAKSIQSSVQKARDAGVKVVAYDRLAQGPVDAYVSYDNHKVGELQGKALLAALGSKAKSGEIVMQNGSPTDPNAAEFKAGAHSVLDGKVKIGKEYDTPNWDPNNANQQMAGAISALGKDKIVGVYSANDGLAAGIATALKAAGISVPLTGQDAQLDAIQRILAGTQTITIEKPYKPEADTAAAMAVDLAQGKDIPKSLTPTTVKSGSGEKVPAKLLTPVVVNKDNIKDTVVKDGLYTVKEICTPAYADACKKAGLQ